MFEKPMVESAPYCFLKRITFWPLVSTKTAFLRPFEKFELDQNLWIVTGKFDPVSLICRPQFWLVGYVSATMGVIWQYSVFVLLAYLYSFTYSLEKNLIIIITFIFQACCLSQVCWSLVRVKLLLLTMVMMILLSPFLQTYLRKFINHITAFLSNLLTVCP